MKKHLPSFCTLILTFCFLCTETKAQPDSGGFAAGNYVQPDLSMAAPFSKVQLTNYPNPIINNTTIKYTIPVNAHVSLRLYTLTGKEIATIIDLNKPAGTYEARFNASTVLNGIYVCRLLVTSTQDVITVTRLLNVAR